MPLEIRLASDLALCAQVTLGAAFLFSGARKALDRTSTEDALATYDLIPRGMVPATVCMLIGVELAVGSAWLLSLALSATAVATTSLLAMFSVALGGQIRAGKRGDCGCGLLSSGEIGRSSLLRNALCAAMAALVVVIPPAPLPLDIVALGMAVGTLTLFVACCVVGLAAMDLVEVARRTT